MGVWRLLYMWMANAKTKQKMALKYAETNAFNTSGAHHEFPNGASGRKPPAPFGEGRLEAAPIMCSTSIESIGLHILYKPHVLKHALYFRAWDTSNLKFA